MRSVAAVWKSPPVRADDPAQLEHRYRPGFVNRISSDLADINVAPGVNLIETTPFVIGDSAC